MSIPYEKSFASHPRAIYWSDKNISKPDQVWMQSGKKYWFDCQDCNHEFDASLDNVFRNKWCPYCGKNKLCSNSECKLCFNKSFASHQKAEFWNDKNKLKPRDVSKCDNDKYYFNCNKCNHELHLTLNSIIQGNNWCKYCTHQSLCNNNECKICFENSFASHSKSEFWSSKNKKLPREVIKGSDIKYLFDCNECKHTFESMLYLITKGGWCNYCWHSSNILCDDNKCKWCFDKSFASHPNAKYWSLKNTLIPRQVKKCCNERFLFNCNECKNEFMGHLGNITIGNNWCPKCVNKTEKILYNSLINYYPTLNHQFKVDWCKNKQLNKFWPFDFVIEELNIIIELDGAQHFEQVSSWKSPEYTQKKDIYKMKCANQNKYSIIRLLQEDVYYKKYDWLTELKSNIEKLVTEKKIQNIFMCKNDEYKIFDNIDYNLVEELDLSEDSYDLLDIDTEENQNIINHN